MKENSIEEDIKIAVDKFSDNKDIDSAMLIVEKFILGNYILLGGNRGNIVKDSLRYILSDYKRALKENEYLKEKWDKDTHILRNELDLINADRLDLLQQNKELRKENNRLEEQVEYDKTHIYTPQTIALNFISIQKVKDIIDRIDYDIKKTKEIISKNTSVFASYRKNDYQIVRLRAMNTKSLDIKKRLQKLLESEQ